MADNTEPALTFLALWSDLHAAAHHFCTTFTAGATAEELTDAFNALVRQLNTGHAVADKIMEQVDGD